MRIAFVSFDFGEYSIRHVTGLARDHQVMLVLPEQRAKPHLSLLDRAVDFRPFAHPRLRQPLRQMKTVVSILRNISKFRPDVVHFQHGHLWFNLALPLLRRYPLVLTIHDPRHHVGDRAQKTPQWIMDFGYRRADRVIVHGEYLKQEVREIFGMSEDRIHVIPIIAIGGGNGQHLADEEENTVLFFGRIWRYKGLEYLIRAEPLITKQIPTAKIVIAGQGEDFAQYRRAMVHPDRFVVHNDFVGEEDAARLFQKASVVVLPYIEATQSAVVPVAYAHAKPVVATRTGAIPEMVDHGHTGFLVPPRDEVALAESIVTLLRDRELRHQMGASGRKKLESECSADTVARQTVQVYCDAIDDITK